MRLIDEISILLQQLKEAVVVCDQHGNIEQQNRPFESLPSIIKNFALEKLTATDLGEHHCSQTSASVNIIELDQYLIAIVHREAQQLITKDSILNELLHSMAKQNNIYQTAAQALGRHLGWKWAAITRFLNAEKVEVLSFWEGSKLSDNFEYDLVNTPCEAVSSRQAFTRFDNLQHDFADDEHIIEMGAQVYGGYVYRDDQNNILGHIFLMHDTPLVDWQLCEEVLHMVSIIVGNSLSLSRKEKEVKKQRGLALTDKLTQLCNRLAFDNDMAREIENAKSSKEEQFVLAVIDLDGMKQVNDTLGHDEGDRLLKTFAEQLKRVGREHDHAYRLGGDEFAYLFRNTHLSQEALLRSRFTQAIVQVKQRGFATVGASIGFASSEEVPGDLKHLIKLADKRMYADKQAKKSS